MAAYDYLCELDRRSQAHTAGAPQDMQRGQRGLAYRIGSRKLISRYEDVTEILTMPPATPLPGSQVWLLGLGNVRGNLLPIVDLKLFLEGERTVLHENQRMLSLRQNGGEVGVLIDELYGQRTFTDADASALGELPEGRYGHFIQQAFALDDGTWGIFDLSTLVRTPEFRQAAV